MIQTAKKIAMKEGIAAVNIRRTASESGIAIGTVYNYFPSKAELMIAVIEDFWRSIFHGKLQCADTCSSFAEFYEQMFFQMKDSLQEFEEKFLRELPLLSQRQRTAGKKVENSYFEHMQLGMLRILQNDDRIPPTCWRGNFTPESFIAFAFSNLIGSIKSGQTDCRFFLEVIERILYA